jgi:soluble lytic murein transglycosylase
MAGNAPTAGPILETLAFDREDDYYGVRAGSLLRDEHGQPQATPDSGADLVPAFDWQAAEAWLTAHTGRILNDAASNRIYSDPRWQRSQELLLLGRRDAADSEGFAAIEAFAGDPIAMYQVARELAEQGRMSLSARAGQRLLRVLDLNPNQGLPKALLSLSYPAAYARLVERHSAEAGVSPLLMLALMRQESFFDPRAESPAGAYGLSQVLPSTAASLANSLGLPEPELADLKQADLNLRLGATYLRNQLADFGQDIYTALAAYNAGPNAASRWVADSNGDADLYLELVEFTETRHYIQFVSENYAIYRYIYGGGDSPSLPPD